jgi:anhydro-N-acetylmuramic acid kinase
MMASYNIIGLMSGTSLDGLDIAYCNYLKSKDGNWKYSCLATSFYPYEPMLQTRMAAASKGSAWDLIQLDKDLAIIWSDMIMDFMSNNAIAGTAVTAISSHGQTVFHRPELGITTQIGCGQSLSTLTGIQVVCDFRTKDVAHGGQGAPLVPIGDKYLFQDKFDAMINIGGFSNITILKGEITAYDICPGNLPLNYLASHIDKAYDKGGENARNGKLVPKLLEEMNQLPFYDQSPPKSLGTEWLETEFYPLIQHGEPMDLLHTVVEHIAQQIAKVCNECSVKHILITGGGALNTYLIERITSMVDGNVLIPNDNVIAFKEAIIFGFLAALRLESMPNCLEEVTGADTSVCGGTIYSP